MIAEQNRMDLSTFFKHFDTLAEAPNGIQRLRELILDMAVRGKLVPQDPEDEPAEKLLKKILLNKTEINKKEKPLPDVNAEEILHQIPDNWIWTRLGEIVNYTVAEKVPSSDISDDAWLLDLEDIEKDTSRLVQRKKFKESPSKSTKSCFRAGDILYGKLRPYLNKVIVADSEGYCTTEIIPIRIYSDLIPEYVKYILKRREFLQYVNSKTYGINLPRLSTDDARKAVFPLPPLAEQKRIVGKVDELMALCDALEAAQKARNTLRQNLRASALDALMNAARDSDLETAWVFVRDNWGLMCDRAEDVERLRKVVLEVASRGCLAHQIIAEGEGKGTLTESIRERKELAQQDLAQKPKLSIPVSSNEYPFPLPKTWVWARIEDVCTHIVDCLHSTPKYQLKGYPAIRTSEMQPGRILYEQAKCVGEEEYKKQTQRLVPKAGDVFYSREGSYGIAAVVPSGIEMCLSQRMMQFRLVSNIYPDFFSWMMNASVVFDQAEADAAGMTVPHINIRALRKFIFPLPPLAEQKRIVAKVDELMKLCDQLEDSLREQQQKAQALAASAISHLAA